MSRARTALAVATSAALSLACGDSGTGATTRAILPRPAATLSSTDSVLARAESLFWKSEYDSAAALWTAALAESRKRTDRVRETRVLTWLGLTTRRQGDLAAARAHLEQALRVGVDAGEPAMLLEAHNGLGLVAQDEDRLVEARRHFEEALRVAETAGDARGMAKASGNLGLTYAYLGELARARQLLTILRDSGHALGDVRYEANGMANLAMLEIWEGQPRVAIPVLDSARALYRKAGYLPGEQNALGQLATAYEELGDFGGAFAALDSSLALARAAEMKEEEAEILRLIAGLHARVGDYRTAMRYYHETATIASALDLTGELGSIRRSTAVIHMELGDIGRARSDARQALRFHRRAGGAFDELDDLLVLAEVEARAGRHDEVARLLAAAGPIADTLGARSAIVAVAMTAARLADRAHDPVGVLRALRGAEREMMPGDFAGAGEMHALAARAYARRGELDSAVAAGRRAIDAIERVRGTLASEQLRRTLLADRSSVYADQVLTLLHLGRPTDAFSVADAARSRGLTEYLASARDDLRRGGPIERIGEGERLLREIDALLAQLRSLDAVPARERGPGATSTSAELMSRLERTRAAYEALLARAGREHPRAAALLGVRATVTEQVQQALDADEALLEYLVAADRVVLFVATRSALRTVELVSGARSLSDRVRLLRELWGNRDVPWQTGLPAARALHRQLLGDATWSGMLRGVRRLIVVPHGVLSQVPFAALVDERSGRFVVQDFEVMYLPSAGTLPVLREDAANRRKSPVGGSAFAPFPRDLPASEAEVSAVRRALPGVTTHVGGAATEAAVVAALGRRELVHVASHGVLNSHNPMFTRIELARPARPARSRGTGADGRLEVHELIAASIRSPLVFLSGCETSAAETWLDDAVRGSDHTTLAQALLYAGAGNVVGTLWRIDDAGA
ncbi:MAG TPA: CHAT domain-containing protein, partial [Gemmatimonadaceae bacterium]|nr:CHAT domain-containing protein [Gemmatimonadaceae bacterium]